jgi:PIN domain nuclease of toxin-antitoxin system
MIKDDFNVVYVSVVSLWEISIKSRRGKLDMNRSFADVIRLLHANGFRLLTIRLRHIRRLNSLELHHKDPFDRMLIAQSLAENFPLVGCDDVFDLYNVQRLW